MGLSLLYSHHITYLYLLWILRPPKTGNCLNSEHTVALDDLLTLLLLETTLYSFTLCAWFDETGKKSRAAADNDDGDDVRPLAGCSK